MLLDTVMADTTELHRCIRWNKMHVKNEQWTTTVWNLGLSLPDFDFHSFSSVIHWINVPWICFPNDD